MGKVEFTKEFQSTPPAREATCVLGISTVITVSIHASRTGGDKSMRYPYSIYNRFNPRLPHGRRLFLCFGDINSNCFNPRLPHGRRRCAAAARS